MGGAGTFEKSQLLNRASHVIIPWRPEKRWGSGDWEFSASVSNSGTRAGRDPRIPFSTNGGEVATIAAAIFRADSPDDWPSRFLRRSIAPTRRD